jgi:catecholate siderophore receptor
MIIRKSLDTYLGNQTDLTNKFSTFGTDHNLVTGISIESESSNPNNFSASGGSTTLSNPAVTYFTTTPTFNGTTSTKVETGGVYALDSIKLNKAWELSLGVRFDNMRTNYDSLSSLGSKTLLSQTNNVFSYSTGLVYKPKENGSIYLSHGTSFNPSAESLSLSTTSFNLDPEKTTSYELGTKWELLNKKLSTTTAIYQVEKDNVRETVNNESVLSGSQRVRGFMVQITGQLTKKWNIIAGYNFMDGKVTKSLASAAQVGRALNNTPEHSFNLFTTYKFDPKLEIGGGVNFVGERFVSPTQSVDSITGTVRNAPSYTIFNTMAKYSLNKNIDLQLNINNVTNEYYFDQLRGSNAVVPGEGRVVLLTTKVKF